MPWIISAQWYEISDADYAPQQKGCKNTVEDLNSRDKDRWDYLEYGDLDSTAPDPGEYGCCVEDELQYLEDMAHHIAYNESSVDQDIWVVGDKKECAFNSNLSCITWGYGRNEKHTFNKKTIHICRVVLPSTTTLVPNWETKILTQHEIGHTTDAGDTNPEQYEHSQANKEVDSNDTWTRFTPIGASYGRDAFGGPDTRYASQDDPPNTFTCDGDENWHGEIGDKEATHPSEYSNCMIFHLGEWRRLHFSWTGHGRAKLNDDWDTINFSNTYEKTPVVIGKPLSQDGPDPAHARFRDIGYDTAECKIEEWNYLDGNHTAEEVGVFAMERGWRWLEDQNREDGTNKPTIVLESGSVDVGTDEWTTVSLNFPLSCQASRKPIVLTTVQSYFGTDPVVTRIRSVRCDDQGTDDLDDDQWKFDVILQEEEGEGLHTSETVGYFAIERSNGYFDGKPFETGRKTIHADQGEWDTISFDNTYNSPVFLADMQTTKGWDTAHLRYTDLTESNVKVQIEEEQSADSEMDHASEEVGYLVLEW